MPVGSAIICARPIMMPTTPVARPSRRMGTSSATIAASATVSAPNPTPRIAEMVSTSGAPIPRRYPTAGKPRRNAETDITVV